MLILVRRSFAVSAVSGFSQGWREWCYSYTRVRNVSSVFGDKVSFGISNAVLLQAPVKIVPFIYIYFVAHLICASSAEIKAAKSHNCIIDRAGHHLSPLDNCIARTEK